MKCHISYLFSLTLLLSSIVNAKTINTLSNVDNDINNKDKYYLIYVNNDYGEYKIFSDNKNHQKRQESELFIESLLDDINTLIINNKDTYENPEKLAEIEKTSHFTKRTNENQTIYNYNESNIVYPISSINNKLVLYAYLSETLAKELPSKFETIIDCIPDKSSFTFFHHNYNIDEILRETHWKNVSIRENADFHLSLLSQGKYDSSLGIPYDNNYYYPSSAGKDVDLVFLDSSFNFNYSEFSNIDDRIVQCSGVVKNGKVSTDVSGGCNISSNYHGESTSVTAAGLTNGVASRANIYGVALESDEYGYISEGSILGGLQYIYENMIRPHKTVVNLSLGGGEKETSSYFILLKELVDGITDKGGIVVAAAGNTGLNLDRYQYYIIPCEYESVICVGGINNKNPDFDNVYKLSSFSNYGKNVTLYAPSYVKVQVLRDSKIVLDETSGTSFSCPLVSGLIATMISENSDIEYTKETILQQLYENGKNQTVILKNGDTGILANNGKHTNYSGEEFIPSTTTHIDIPTSTTEEPTNSSVTNLEPTTIVNTQPTSDPIPEDECHSLKLGYPCCRSCRVVREDSQGKWGIENDNWCGIKFSC